MIVLKACVLIPTYNNPQTIRKVVLEARKYMEQVVVVDDGSAEAGRQACADIAQEGLAHVHHRELNGGKGAAVKTGLEVARGLGFTHVLQIDGDGQHDVSLLPKLLETAQSEPSALVLGYPEYDESVPSVRLMARKITSFWVTLEVGAGVIKDAMVGFRAYPVQAAIDAQAQGDRMDFDVEIAVRMAWSGAKVVNFPVPVKYLSAEEGGVSHFQPFLDNLRFSWLHTKLCTTRMFRWLSKLLLRRGN